MNNCEHKRTQTLRSGSTYCVDCGMRMITPPPPIRYEENLKDGREQNWHAIQPGCKMPLEFMVVLGRTYIGALYDKAEQCWRIGRVQWCDDCDQWEVEQGLGLWQRAHQRAPITHVSEDVLGVPRAP